jgi:hypothetical protein
MSRCQRTSLRNRPPCHNCFCTYHVQMRIYIYTVFFLFFFCFFLYLVIYVRNRAIGQCDWYMCSSRNNNNKTTTTTTTKDVEKWNIFQISTARARTRVQFCRGLLDPIVTNDIVPKITHGTGKITVDMRWCGEIHVLRHIRLRRGNGWPTGPGIALRRQIGPVRGDRRR